MIKSSILIGLSFLVSKVLGLVRETLLASYFGIPTDTGKYNLDAYFAAFKLPDFIFNIVSSGVIAAAFIPLFIEYYSKHNPERARRFACDSLYALTSFAACASFIFFIGAPYFVTLLAPGFEGELFDTTVQLTRLMLITPLIFTISGVLNGINNALNHFKGMALAPLFYNVGIIVGIGIWGKTYGVYGVAWGVILGAIMSMLAQLPEVLKSGFFLSSPRKMSSEHIQRLLSLALPRIGGMSITQLSLFVDTFLASLLMAGSLTYMHLATNLYFVPIGVIAISIAVTRFGQLSTLALNHNNHDFENVLRTSLQTLFFLLIPTTMGMIIISKPLVDGLFVHGAFTMENGVITARTVQILSLGIIGTSLVQVLARAFYALKDTKTPLRIGIKAFIINGIVGALAAFYFKLNTYGLALGTAVASTIYSILLFHHLKKKLTGSSLISWSEVTKYIIATIAMGCTLLGLLFIGETYIPNVWLQIIILVIGGSVLYVGVLYLLHSRELTLWLHTIHGYVIRRLSSERRL